MIRNPVSTGLPPLGTAAAFRPRARHPDAPPPRFVRKLQFSIPLYLLLIATRYRVFNASETPLQSHHGIPILLPRIQ